MAFGDDDDYDDDYDYGDDYDYNDDYDYDVGTLIKQIELIYADFHKKNKSAESAQSAGSNPQIVSN